MDTVLAHVTLTWKEELFDQKSDCYKFQTNSVFLMNTPEAGSMFYCINVLLLFSGSLCAGIFLMSMKGN